MVRLFDSYRGTIARTWNLKESLEKKERDSSAKYRYLRVDLSFLSISEEFTAGC